MSSLIVSPHDPNGHKSASQRREMAMRETMAMQAAVIEHLKAVIVIALEQRGGVPLLVLAQRRIEILSAGKTYRFEQTTEGDVTYSLQIEPAPAAPAPEPEAEGTPT
jgi:hypothetical protein